MRSNIVCCHHTHTKTHKVVNMWWQVHRGVLLITQSLCQRWAEGVPTCLPLIYGSKYLLCQTQHIVTTTLPSFFCFRYCTVLSWKLVSDDDCCDISVPLLASCLDAPPSNVSMWQQWVSLHIYAYYIRTCTLTYTMYSGYISNVSTWHQWVPALCRKHPCCGLFLLNNYRSPL